jgi:hypothetical protein
MGFKNLILEDGRRRDIIRIVVKDIIKLYKDEDEGEFYLPNYYDDENDFYEFLKLGEAFVVEVVLKQNEDLESFKVNADYYQNDDIIGVTIEYNPNNKTRMTYDLVGELNEVISHEIRHIDQKVKGTFDLDVPEEKDPYKYYIQPHQLDAQVFGFKRLAKITKTPIDVVVKRWFKTHGDVHRLTDEQAQDVISKILNYKK